MSLAVPNELDYLMHCSRTASNEPVIFYVLHKDLVLQFMTLYEIHQSNPNNRADQKKQ
jgi:hypothetical protein